MRIRSYLTPAILYTVISANAASAQEGSRDDRAAIAQLIEQVQAANNAGAVESWVGLFANDFVYMAPGAPPVTTRDGLVDVARTGFRNQASVDIEPVEIQVFGNWAFARTRVIGSVKLHDSGNMIRVDVKQLVIYRKNEQGRWRIARLISNSNSQ